MGQARLPAVRPIGMSTPPWPPTAQRDPTKGELAVRYITHQFAHPETLDRARRWLIQAGIDPSRIEAHPHGTPRLAVAVEPGEAAEVALLIDAAEAGDPDGFPSFLELARQQHIYPQVMEPHDSVAKEARS